MCNLVIEFEPSKLLQQVKKWAVCIFWINAVKYKEDRAYDTVFWYTSSGNQKIPLIDY